MKIRRQFLVATLSWCLLGGAFALCQESPDSNRKPLGYVARQQKKEREHGKKAARVIGDEDIVGPHMRRVTQWVATQIIIPAIRVTAVVPDTAKTSGQPDLADKMMTWFGPDLTACGLECAEAEYVRQFNAVHKGKLKILFSGNDSVGGYEAIVGHFELVDEYRGKMLGVFALIQTPVSISPATCMYRADAPEIEPACEAFISSIEVHMPEKYIYVEHHNYY